MKMNKRRSLILILTILILDIVVTVISVNTVWALDNKKLTFEVLSTDNEKIEKVGDGYFSNKEIKIKPIDDIEIKNDEDIQRKLYMSMYDGTEFSEYEECLDDEITIKPKDRIPYEFKAIKIKEIANVNNEYKVYESDVINLSFDNISPEIKGDSSIDLLKPVNAGTDYKIGITDESGIGTIKISNNDEVIDEIELCQPKIGSDDFRRITEYEYTLTLNGESGKNKITIEVVDLCSNKSELNFEYTIDSVAPSISVSGIENGQIYNKSAEFSIDVFDNMQDMYLYYKCTYTGMDGVAKTIEEGLSRIEQTQFSIAKNYNAEGIYDIELYAKDGQDNKTDTYYLCFAIDSNAPAVQIANIENGKIYKSGIEVYCVVSDMFFTGVNVSVSCERTFINSDNKTLSEKKTEVCNLAPFNMAAKTSKAIYKFVEDGEYRISVIATDSQGNASEASAYFTVDSTAPEITITNDSFITEGAAFITKAPEFNVRVTGDTLGTNLTATLYRVGQGKIYEKVDEKIFVDSKGDIMCPFKIENDGEYVISATAIDKAGNKDTKLVEFTLDMNPPVIGYIDAYNEKFLKGFTLPENLREYIKDTTAVKYRAYLNEEEIGYGDIKSDGRYLLQITAIDEAGNTAEGMAAFIIDSTAPKIVVSGMSNSEETSDEAIVDRGEVINVSLLDEDDWFEKVTVNGIEVDVNRLKKTLELKVDNFGEYNVEILARDYAGNETTKVINTKCLASAGLINDNVEIKTLTKNTSKNREIFTREKPSLKFYVFCGFIFATSVIFIVFALFDIKKIKC